jgi:CubicO group peptidase (beta-lactamase class C family)
MAPIHSPAPLAWILLSLAAGCANPPQAAPGADPVEEARIAAIEANILPLVRVEGRPTDPTTLSARMEELGVPGVSAAVVRDGRVAWARAWGMADVEEGRAATPETLFQAASISKPVAATGALLLVDEEVLSLDGPVNEHLPGWRLPEHPWEARRPVTLRHLLTHTGGLTVHGFPGYRRGTPLPTLPQILDGAEPSNTGAVRVDQEPGSRWRYSGGGTTIVQLLMDQVTGEAFEDWMEARVLGPLGMTSSTYRQPLPDSLHPRAATAYLANGSAVDGAWHVYPEQAAAGLWTTPTDLARWILAVQGAVNGDDGGAAPILAGETARAMVTAGEGGWGLGPAVSGEGSAHRFSHGGANRGFRAELTGWVEDGRGIVVMSNSDQGGILVRELAMAIAAEYGWEGYEPRTLVPLRVPEDELDGYAGRYRLEDPTLEVSVTRDGSALYLTLPDGQPQEVVLTTEDAFTELGTGQSGRFERDDGGRVRALVMGQVRLERVED